MRITTEVIKEEIKSNIAAFSKKAGFIRNSFNLTLGTSVSQGIPIILSPILSRLFTPQEFGLFAIISTITIIINVISTGKYETVIVIAKTRKEAINLVALSLILSFVISLFVLILFSLFSNVLINALHQPNIKYWIFLCPLISLLISVYTCYNEWCIRNSQFVILAYNKVVNSSSISLSNVFFGVFRTSGGLVLGEILGRTITAIFCIAEVARKKMFQFKDISILRMRILSKKYIDCPKFIMPGQFMNTFGGQAIILLIASFFGDTVVGYYSMTGIVLYVPSTIISTAVRDVFKQRATAEFNIKGNCVDIFKRITITITILSFFVFGILFFILPDLFSFAFGEKWRIAGEYARILCPMVFISFISESVFGIFIIAGKMKAVLFWQATYLSVNVLSLIIGYYLFKDIKMVLLCFMIGKSFVHLYGLYLSYQFAKGGR
jgi:O-antigen/teichoic acid export membrane protein